jgi:regulator of nonsense transcripts 3
MRIYLLKKFVLKGLSEATKETPITISTPSMEFVRQKRADKGGNKVAFKSTFFYFLSI